MIPKGLFTPRTVNVLFNLVRIIVTVMVVIVGAVVITINLQKQISWY